WTPNGCPWPAPGPPGRAPRPRLRRRPGRRAAGPQQAPPQARLRPAPRRRPGCGPRRNGRGTAPRRPGRRRPRAPPATAGGAPAGWSPAPGRGRSRTAGLRHGPRPGCWRASARRARGRRISAHRLRAAAPDRCPHRDRAGTDASAPRPAARRHPAAPGHAAGGACRSSTRGRPRRTRHRFSCNHHGGGPDRDQASGTLWERPWSRKAFARERAPTDRAPTGEGRSAGSAAVFRAPARVGARGERQVVVARLVGDLAADPWRQGEVLVDARQLDLGHHQSRVLAQELVDLPQMPLVADQVPALVDRAAHAQRQQLARIVHRDRVVELLPAAPELARLEVEEGFVTLDAHPHRRVLLAAVHGAEVVDIALGHGQDGVGGGAPGCVGDEEFAFDFEGHGERSWWLGVGSWWCCWNGIAVRNSTTQLLLRVLATEARSLPRPGLRVSR